MTVFSTMSALSSWSAAAVSGTSTKAVEPGCAPTAAPDTFTLSVASASLNWRNEARTVMVASPSDLPYTVSASPLYVATATLALLDDATAVG